MSLTYQIYISSLNKEGTNEDNDWGQHYDMESQMLNISLKHPILKYPILKHPILNQLKQVKEINHEPQKDIESGLKEALQKYTANQLNNNQNKYSCKSTIITSVIYISHLVLFIMLFK
jgi:hypothetical protein